MSKETGQPTAGQGADDLIAKAKTQGAIAAKALALAETWISTGVMDDTLSEPLNETDPGRAAHIIANEAILDALGVEDLSFELSPQIETLVEKRMADLNAGYVRLETLEHAMDEILEQLTTEAWRKPAARNPALCVKGTPLPQHLPKAGKPEAEEWQISCEYAQIKDLQLCLDTGKCVHAEDISELQVALQEALRRAHGDPEVRIIEIIDRV